MIGLLLRSLVLALAVGSLWLFLRLCCVGDMFSYMAVASWRTQCHGGSWQTSSKVVCVDSHFFGLLLYQSRLRACPEIILGGAQTLFCPVGGGCFVTMCPRGRGWGGNLSWGSRCIWSIVVQVNWSTYVSLGSGGSDSLCVLGVEGSEKNVAHAPWWKFLEQPLAASIM